MTNEIRYMFSDGRFYVIPVEDEEDKKLKEANKEVNKISVTIKTDSQCHRRIIKDGTYKLQELLQNLVNIVHMHHPNTYLCNCGDDSDN